MAYVNKYGEILTEPAAPRLETQVPEWQPMPPPQGLDSEPMQILLHDREFGNFIQVTAPLSLVRSRMWMADGFMWWTPAPTLPKGTPE